MHSIGEQRGSYTLPENFNDPPPSMKNDPHPDFELLRLVVEKKLKPVVGLKS